MAPTTTARARGDYLQRFVYSQFRNKLSLHIKLGLNYGRIDGLRIFCFIYLFYLLNYECFVLFCLFVFVLFTNLISNLNKSDTKHTRHGRGRESESRTRRRTAELLWYYMCKIIVYTAELMCYFGGFIGYEKQ